MPSALEYIAGANPDKNLTSNELTRRNITLFFVRANHTDLISVKARKNLVGNIGLGCDEERNNIMADQAKRSSVKISRRSVLLHGAMRDGAATILVANANYAKANPLKPR